MKTDNFYFLFAKQTVKQEANGTVILAHRFPCLTHQNLLKDHPASLNYISLHQPQLGYLATEFWQSTKRQVDQRT